MCNIVYVYWGDFDRILHKEYIKKYEEHVRSYSKLSTTIKYENFVYLWMGKLLVLLLVEHSNKIYFYQ
jgi:hypothetical protein